MFNCAVYCFCLLVYVVIWINSKINMASKTLAPVADHQQQDEQSIEETNKSMTRNLLLSGVQNLAISDESLTQQEETQLVSATKVTLGETVDPAVEVGQDLRGLADEVDSILDDVKGIIDGLLDQDREVSTQKLLSFITNMVGEIVKNGISKGVVMTIVMVAYALIRNYLKRYINEDILDFIENMAKLLYQVFVKYGIIDWILSIGGWTVLKSMTRNILSGLKKSHWVVIGSVGLLITGVSAYNFFYA